MRIVKARDGRKGIEIKIGMDYNTMDFAERSGFNRRQDIGRPTAEQQLAQVQVLPPADPVAPGERHPALSASNPFG